MDGDVTVTWREVLDEAAARLVDRLGPSARQEARWMVERASGAEGAELVLQLDEPVATRHLAFFDGMVTRRLNGEPLQYVLGRWSFRGIELFVDRRVLIPRPETEVVAGHAIDALRAATPPEGRGRRAADLGTGSGAIAVALAIEVGDAQVWATDLSADALAVARANLTGAGSLVATRVTLAEGSWFTALPPELAGTLDVIASNPPYVATTDEVGPDVFEWEPHSALFAGEDGMDALVELVEQAPRWLAPGGTLVLELAPAQAVAVAERAQRRGFAEVRIERDLAGRDRAVVARWPA